MKRRGQVALLAAAVLALPCCRRSSESPVTTDLITRGHEADLRFERVGHNLLTDPDDPDLLSGFAPFDSIAGAPASGWTIGDESRFAFTLLRSRPLGLRVRATPLDYPGRPDPAVEIALNGAPLGAHRVTDGVLAVDLTEAALRPGRNEIRLRHSWARSPRAINGNPDDRRLALHVTGLYVVDAGNTAIPSGDPPPPVVDAPPDLASGRLVAFTLEQPRRGLAVTVRLRAEAPRELTCEANGVRLEPVSVMPQWQPAVITVPVFLLRGGRNLLFCAGAAGVQAEGVALAFTAGTGMLAHAGADHIAGSSGGWRQPAGTAIGLTLPLPRGARLRATARAAGAVSLIAWLEDEEGGIHALHDGVLPADGELLWDLASQAGRLTTLHLAAVKTGSGEGEIAWPRLQLGSDEPLAEPEVGPRSAAASHPTPAPRQRPRTILVYLVDTLRVDRLSHYGYTRPTSPRLTEFAQGAETFHAAYAVTSWTKAATASLLTGLTPAENGAGTRLSRLNSDVPYLPAALKSLGYRTAAVVVNPFVGPAFGFERGFDDFRYRYSERRLNDSSVMANEELASILRATPKDAPLFVYLHTVDPHTPYLPPRGFDRFTQTPQDGAWGTRAKVHALATQVMFQAAPPEALRALSDLYDGEVLHADAGFGATLDLLRSHGRADDALVVFVSDHGEEFAEHHGLEHGQSLFAEVLRIPLIVRWPHGRRAGAMTAAPVSQLDVTPTILREAGAAVPDGAFTLDGSASERVVTGTLELDHRREVFLRWRNWGYHRVDRRSRSPQYYARPAESLFDLGKDPLEQHDISSRHTVLTAYLRGLSRRESFSPQGGEDVTDPETLERLGALGYVR